MRRGTWLLALALIAISPTPTRAVGPAAPAAGAAIAEWVGAGATAVEAGVAGLAVAQATQHNVPEARDIAIGLDPEMALVVGDDANIKLRITGSFGDVGELDDANDAGQLWVYMETRSHPFEQIATGISNGQPIFDRHVSPTPRMEAQHQGDDHIGVGLIVRGDDSTSWSFDESKTVSLTDLRTLVVQRPYHLLGTNGEPYYSTLEIEHGNPVRTWLHMKVRTTEDGEVVIAQIAQASVLFRPLMHVDVRGSEREEQILEWIQGHWAAHPCGQTMTFKVRPFDAHYMISPDQFDLPKGFPWTGENHLGEITVICKADCAAGTTLPSDLFREESTYGFTSPSQSDPAPRQVGFRLVDPSGGGVPGSYVVLRDSFGNEGTLEPDPEGIAAGELVLGGQVAVSVVGGPYHLDVEAMYAAEDLETEQIVTLHQTNTPDVVGRIVDDEGAPMEATIYLLPGDAALLALYSAWAASIPPGTDPVAPAWLAALSSTPTVDGDFHVGSQREILDMGPDPANAALVVVPRRRLGRSFAGTPVRLVPVDLTERQTIQLADVTLPMAPPAGPTATIDYVFSRFDTNGVVMPLAGVHIVAVDPSTSEVFADGTSDPFGGLALTVPTGIPVELRVAPAEATALGVIAPADRIIRIDRDVAISRRVPVPNATVGAIVRMGTMMRLVGTGTPGASVELQSGGNLLATAVVSGTGAFSVDVTAAVGTEVGVRQIVNGGASSRVPLTLDKATALNLALAHIHDDRPQAALDLDGDGAIGATDLQRLANAF